MCGPTLSWWVVVDVSDEWVAGMFLVHTVVVSFRPRFLIGCNAGRFLLPTLTALLIGIQI